MDRIIRTATLADLDAVAAVERRAFPRRRPRRARSSQTGWRTTAATSG